VPQVTGRTHDFRHGCLVQVVPYNDRVRDTRLLRVAGIGTWVVCGIPPLAAIVSGSARPEPFAWWAVAYGAYGASMIGALRARENVPRLATVLLAVQSVSAVLATYLTGVYLDLTGMGLLVGVGLMVVVAAQLPHLVRPRAVAIWIGVQTTAMALLVAPGVGMADAAAFGLGSAGFEMFASLTTGLMLREAAAREDLARVNRELQATRAMLVEHSRAGERLRIARDLHDSLGHHLTGLSLQLDVASRLSDGSAAGTHVRQAHTVARLLLAEVRNVVSEMRDRTPVNVGGAIRELGASTDSLRVHVDVADGLTLDDGAQAQSLLRCVQEVITNTTRNLWIRIRVGDRGIELHARDDGRGVDRLHLGNGLKGMQERFAEYSGRLDVAAGPGRGFEIDGFMPLAGAR